LSTGSRFDEVRTAKGKRQWNNRGFGGSDADPPFMMLAVDMALGRDSPWAVKSFVPRLCIFP
jgi:hypothetical protein